MKLLSTFLIFIGLTAQAQMNFAHTNGTISANLPTVLQNVGSVTYGPTMVQCNAQGWYSVSSVQSPTNGWAVDSYNVVPGANMTCTLAIKTQHNIQSALDTTITNQPAWTGTFVTNAQKFRATLRAAGTTETNAVVTVDTINWYISQQIQTNTTAVIMSLASYIFMANEAAQLLILGQCDTTAHFPWRLIP